MGVPQALLNAQGLAPCGGAGDVKFVRRAPGRLNAKRRVFFTILSIVSTYMIYTILIGYYNSKKRKKNKTK